MPQFILNHGTPEAGRAFCALDSFAQGYVTAALWTEEERLEEEGCDGASVADLEAETLAQMVADCAAFRQSPAWLALLEALGNEELGDFESDLATRVQGDPDNAAGHDLWLTRNGHGAGFWDGDWPEPHASALAKAADDLGEFELMVGGGGFIYGT